jgi:beta-mannosidase
VLAAGESGSWSVDGLFERFLDTTWAHRFGPKEFGAITARLHGQDFDSIDVLNVGYPAEISHCDCVVDAILTDEADKALLTIESTYLLQWVRVEASGWMPEENYFHVVPGVRKTVRLRRDADRCPNGEIILRPLNSVRAIKTEVQNRAA